MKDDQWINMPGLSLTPTLLTASSTRHCNNRVCDGNDRSGILPAGNDGDLI